MSESFAPSDETGGTDEPRLTHVRVNVRDLERAIAWYEDRLGVRAAGHWPPNAPTYVHFGFGPTQLGLGRYDPAPATGARFNFEVDDVDAWWERLKDEDIVEPLFDTPYGSRKFTIRDPDGNELGFVQA
jgi:predicted enzyme related to lactoylglutathione lyase